MNFKAFTPRFLANMVALLLTAIMFTGNSTAEEMPDSEFQMLREGSELSGTVNSVNPELGIVIIDDRSFLLDRVVHFNNATWSREQVLRRLEPGNTVKIEVGKVVDPSRGARLIRSLDVADK